MRQCFSRILKKCVSKKKNLFKMWRKMKIGRKSRRQSSWSRDTSTTFSRLKREFLMSPSQIFRESMQRFLKMARTVLRHLLIKAVMKKKVWAASVWHERVFTLFHFIKSLKNVLHLTYIVFLCFLSQIHLHNFQHITFECRTNLFSQTFYERIVRQICDHDHECFGSYLFALIIVWNVSHVVRISVWEISSFGIVSSKVQILIVKVLICL